MTSDIGIRRLSDPTGITSDITNPAEGPRRRGRAPALLPAELEAICTLYAGQLRNAPLDDDTRRAYISRMRTFFAWLAEADVDGAPLTDPAARDGAVRDYRAYMQTIVKRKPTTINAHLAALADFFTRSGLGPPEARRLDLPKTAPKALSAREQTRWLRACERRPLSRDRVLGHLPFYAGLRIGEAVALDLNDVQMSARKGVIIVRSGKGGRYREVPAHAALRDSLSHWMTDRATWPGAESAALILNRRGQRLTPKGADAILGEIGDDAHIDDYTTHLGRHTFGTNLVRDGVDIVTVAELMGHARLDTTRGYTLPTAEDLAAAVDRLPVDG